MDFTITQEEQNILLTDAREAITAKIEGRPPMYRQGPDLKKNEPSILDQQCGAFVTLHIKKRLRGCIGNMGTSEKTLEQLVPLMAIEAAFRDPRFPPLTSSELAQCSIEISILSRLELCSDTRLIQVGVHGLYLVHQGKAGILLPQVPVEQGWNLEAYLTSICAKAGLLPNSYNAPGAKLYTFTALVFGEQ